MESLTDYSQVRVKILVSIQFSDLILIRIQQNTGDRDGFLAVFGEGDILNTQMDKTTRGETKIMAQILKEMSLIDPELSEVAIQAWASFVKHCSTRVRSDSFPSFEEYLPYRLVDIGELYEIHHKSDEY